MRGGVLIGAVAIFVAMINAASACVYNWEISSASEIMSESRPVAADRQCRTINAGVYDELSLGRATDLGNRRVQQVVDERNLSRVLLADCNTREVTILQGDETESWETSCGTDYSYAPITGDKAPMSLAEGADLHQLAELAAARGMTEIDPNEYFFTFYAKGGPRAVGQKDRFDLLCGCKLFYPDSPGARQ